MKGKTGIIAAALALGAFALWLLAGKTVTAELVYPAENGVGFFWRHFVLPVRDVFSNLDLARENRRLKDEIAALRLRLVGHDALQTENGRLREALDFVRREPDRWIPAPVLARGGTLGVGTRLRIGKGSLAGIRAGAAVVVPEGIVGRVSATSPHTSEVRLITDREVKVACEIEAEGIDRRSTFGILSGERLTHLKHALIVPPRARVVTSGLGGVYPQGLAVGHLINGTHEDETQLEREGELVPAVDFSTLENVFIRRED